MNYSVGHLRAELTPAQQLAAEIIVDNDFMSRVDGGRRTYEEMAAEVGVSRATLFNWKKEALFIAYMQSISDRKLGQHRAKADAMLLKLIDGTSNNGVGSIKALQLYYTLEGRLINRSEVVTHGADKPPLTPAEIDAGIEELAKKLQR